MDLREIFKLQMITGGGASRGGSSDVFSSALLFLAVGLGEELVRHMPRLLEFLKNRYMDRVIHGAMRAASTLGAERLADTAVPLTERHSLTCVTMTRVDEPDEKSRNADWEGVKASNQLVDAMLARISKLENVPALKLDKHCRLLACYEDRAIQLTEHAYVQLHREPTSLQVKLMSNTLSAPALACLVQQTYEEHQIDLKNALGDAICYFDVKHTTNSRPIIPLQKDKESMAMARRQVIACAPKHLPFSRTPFLSNKNFSNVFGKQAEDVKQRVRFFSENKAWYDSHGIPYQLGILLSGPPGTGKTSLIRAIANHTRRHIVNVNFSSIQTATQLKNLFYSPVLETHGTEVDMLEIPVDRRLYVLEEIDALGTIVHERENKDEVADTVEDELTLGDILCVLDGTLEVPGRMVVITTNHTHLLDKALLRPGRIDMMVHFDLADSTLIQEMYSSFFGTHMGEEAVACLPDKQLTAAEVSQSMLNHFDAMLVGPKDDGLLVAKNLEAAALAKKSVQA